MPKKWINEDKVSIRLDLEGELLGMFKQILKEHNIDTASATEGLRFLIRQEHKRITRKKQ